MISHAQCLPQFLQDLLATPPRAGQGIHNWLFRVARQLHAHLPAGEIIRLLETKVANCGRHVPHSEIVSAVQNSLSCAWSRPGHQQSASYRKWPSANKELRQAIINGGVGLVGLWEASPFRLESNESQSEEIIDVLFPGNPLLCCGKSNSDFDTKEREAWRGQLAELSLIVPSQMSSMTGLTKAGKPSKHTLSNTGPRRFLVIEFDSGDFDEHATLLLHLARFGPLVLAVHSGNKSLHGWFYVQGRAHEKVWRFMQYAVALGADPATWTKSQFVRMPEGTRDNGNRQVVYFFHPQLLDL